MRPKTAKPKMEGNFAYAQNFTDKLASVDRGTTQTQKLLIFGRRPKSARANLSPGARCGDFRSADSNFSKSSFDNTSLAAGLRKSSDKFQQNSPSRTLFHCTDPQIKDKELPARTMNELEGIWSLEPCFEDVKEPNHGNGSHVEIYPASATMNPLPPKAPFLQDPSPRRRFVQPQIELLGANARPFVSRTEVLKELQPALRSISKLCTESHLGKLAMQVQDIVLVRQMRQFSSSFACFDKSTMPNVNRRYSPNLTYALSVFLIPAAKHCRQCRAQIWIWNKSFPSPPVSRVASLALRQSRPRACVSTTFSRARTSTRIATCV